MATAVSAKHRNGIAVDTEKLGLLRESRLDIRRDLIAKYDKPYPVYKGEAFNFDLFGQFLTAYNIHSWPVTEKTGRLRSDDDTFKAMAIHPPIKKLRTLRNTLDQLDNFSLQVGKDGRNRSSIYPLWTVTGRNQPRNIFSLSSWFRFFIKPTPGYAIAYIDWDQQEPGIAAALSGDLAMQADYLSGNFYIGTAVRAGAMPAGATKKSHRSIYDVYKEVGLGMNYGMGPYTLASRINRSVAVACDLIQTHHKLYPVFWKWSDGNLNIMYGRGVLSTNFGRKVHEGARIRPTFLRNFLMQAHGADMMRIAGILATARGVEICATVHGAFLIHAPADRIDAAVITMQAAMAEASRITLNGFELRSTVEGSWRYPERYQDKDAQEMWDTIMMLLDRGAERIA
jgi:hypothetical protein